MEIAIAILLFIIGACLGSFLCCQARRLHLKETKKKKFGPRSVCLNCKTKIKWHDNIPIISWLILKGKCRKCGKKIGLAEILSELGCAIALLLLSLNLNLENIYFLVVFSIFVLNLIFLAIYDGLYSELPTLNLYLAILLAIVLAIINNTSALDAFFSVAILGGIYLALYLISKGKWVGDGDWLLGVAIGLTIGKPFLSLVVLFLSNFLACLIMMPKAKGKNLKIPFGPFLIAAFLIVFAFQNMIQ